VGTPDLGPVPLASAVAPGKVILLGEHAVVYGRPAIAIPVDAVEARAVVWPSDRPLAVEARFPDDEGQEPQSYDVAGANEALAAAVRAALAFAGRRDPPTWLVQVSSSVPTGRGMGSSAAVAVAAVRAVARAASAHPDDAAVGAMAREAERVTHGTPSGIDDTVIALGRPIRFSGGVGSPLAPKAALTFLVADSGARGPTRALVEGVRDRRAERPDVYEAWFDRVGRLVDDAAAALAAGDTSRLGRLMDANHLVLQAMRLSTPNLDRLVGAARAAGARGAKLSGAGGGGVVVALVEAAGADAVEAALVEAGAARVYRTTLAAAP